MCSEAEGNCGSSLAIPYFISFQIIGSFVFLNLVVAIILENFTSLGSENPKLASSADVEAFKEVWAIFDPDADNFIPSRQLHQLVVRLALRGRVVAQDVLQAVPPPALSDRKKMNMDLGQLLPPVASSTRRSSIRRGTDVYVC